MIAVGVLSALGVLHLYGKKENFSQKFSDFLFYNGLFSVAVGLGSAALFQAVYNYIEDPSQGFKFDGSITFIGGLIGGAAFFLIVYFILRNRIDGKLSDALPIIPTCITLAHGFGRIGCFFGGCCYGRETECFLGVRFPGFPRPVHPTQLYEAAFLFALCGVMTYLLIKKKFMHNMSVYLISYGVFRFAIEYLRDDHRGEFVAGVTPSQFWSLCMIVLGIFLIFITKRQSADKAFEEVSEEVQEKQDKECEVDDEEKKENID
jgi:phosphatidylglycerol:prolipoprotein diacylglycerol transferase